MLGRLLIRSRIDRFTQPRLYSFPAEGLPFIPICVHASCPSAVRTCSFDARELGIIVWRHVRGSAQCHYSSHKWASAVRLSG